MRYLVNIIYQYNFAYCVLLYINDQFSNLKMLTFQYLAKYCSMNTLKQLIFGYKYRLIFYV